MEHEKSSIPSSDWLNDDELLKWLEPVIYTTLGEFESQGGGFKIDPSFLESKIQTVSYGFRTLPPRIGFIETTHRDAHFAVKSYRMQEELYGMSLKLPALSSDSPELHWLLKHRYLPVPNGWLFKTDHSLQNPAVSEGRKIYTSVLISGGELDSEIKSAIEMMRRSSQMNPHIPVEGFFSDGSNIRSLNTILTTVSDPIQIDDKRSKFFLGFVPGPTVHSQLEADMHIPKLSPEYKELHKLELMAISQMTGAYQALPYPVPANAKKPDWWHLRPDCVEIKESYRANVKRTIRSLIKYTDLTFPKRHLNHALKLLDAVYLKIIVDDDLLMGNVGKYLDAALRNWIWNIQSEGEDGSYHTTQLIIDKLSDNHPDAVALDRIQSWERAESWFYKVMDSIDDENCDISDISKLIADGPETNLVDDPPMNYYLIWKYLRRIDFGSSHRLWAIYEEDLAHINENLFVFLSKEEKAVNHAIMTLTRIAIKAFNSTNMASNERSKLTYEIGEQIRDIRLGKISPMDSPHFELYVLKNWYAIITVIWGRKLRSTEVTLDYYHKALSSQEEEEDISSILSARLNEASKLLSKTIEDLPLLLDGMDIEPHSRVYRDGANALIDLLFDIQGSLDDKARL